MTQSDAAGGNHGRRAIQEPRASRVRLPLVVDFEVLGKVEVYASSGKPALEYQLNRVVLTRAAEGVNISFQNSGNLTVGIDLDLDPEDAADLGIALLQARDVILKRRTEE